MADQFQANRAPGPGAAGPPPTTAGAKARQFEDEKKRITASCFSKPDVDGALLESYITHCRVIEDGASPSSPPLADGPRDQKKSRVIVVAVRKTGRVRMHKARENPNGGFQIGKTWNLDDLTEIENYIAPFEKGFTVTIIKPYYWQANSSKEKDFFISSLLKIYKKYTGGKIPTLIGFAGTEVDKMLGGAASLQEGQRDDMGGASPAGPSPISPGPSQFSSSLKPTPLRNLTSAVSMDNMASPGRQPSPRNKGIDGLRTGPGALRPSQSSDPLPSSRRPPDLAPGSRNISGASAYSTASGAALSDPSPPPIPPQGPGRRPSNGSSRSGRDRSGTRGTPIEDERGIRRMPSSERMFRTPSASSHQSREAIEQYPYGGGNRGPPPPAAPPEPSPLVDARGLAKKMSSKDVASQFRLAANTYAAGGMMGDRRQRPKTPTTPTAMSRTPSQDPGRQEEVPMIKYPEERKDRDARGGNGSYGAAGAPGERRRSPSRTRDPPPPSSNQRSPEKQMELPPRSEVRRATLTSKDKPPMLPSPTPRNASPGRPKHNSLEIPTASGRSTSPDGLGDVGERGERSRSRSPNTKGRKRKSVKSSYLDDVDTSRVTVDIEDLLREFDWDPQGKVDVLETKIRREIAEVEAKDVIVNTDGDPRIEELSGLLDKAILECDEMDSLLTLYAVELTSLNDDISHIENQSQGLQVQTANQKTLQRELQNLMSIISIVPQQLEVLKYGPLDSSQALQSIEDTLLALYKAMTIIDPKMARHAPELPVGDGRRGSWSDEGIGSMKALQERKEGYQKDAQLFLARMKQFMTIKFGAEVVELAKNSKNSPMSPGQPRLLGHDSAYMALYKFSGLIAFAKDADLEEYYGLQKLYEKPVSGLFQEEFREHVLAWKKITKKPISDEVDLLFTAQEKEADNVAVTAARKLTVKRSQTLAKIRSPTSDHSKNKNQDGMINSHESFAGALAEMYNLILREQNFVVEFFQMSSQLPQDFAEFIVNSPTAEHRKIGDLGGLRPAETDKAKAKMVSDFMTELFGFLPQDLQSLIEWAIRMDPLQGVGVLHALEMKMAVLPDTDQEFLLKMLQKLHDRLAGLFSRFLDDQVKAIEETKVKIKKRKGVIPFMKVFPSFASRIEDQLPAEVPGSSTDLDIRDLVNDGYERINKAMFESLHAIAKESPTVTNSSLDPEDKEQLNYHIMMIENMHHYLEELPLNTTNPILTLFKTRAERDLAEHLGLYTSSVIRRPLGKLLDFVESIEVLQRNGADDIPSRQSHSRQVFKKVLAHHDGKEIRRGIETLKKRVDKHFATDGGDDDAVLVDRILAALEKEFIDVHRRTQLLTQTVYKEAGLEMEFLVADVVGGFKKQH
ncbi:exocyst complex component Sec3-domain-containing protein [Tuber brumale]|nr:exocyst complex component Sec3-domain-containing protein [Tuber brumale]